VQISDRIFESWVQQHRRLLFGIAYWWTGSRTDAEELTQEAFFQAYRSRATLRDVEAVKKLAGWHFAALLCADAAQTRFRGGNFNRGDGAFSRAPGV
jgi:RNA polymerase sigma-70 factor (ECF subfamily)